MTKLNGVLMDDGCTTVALGMKARVAIVERSHFGGVLECGMHSLQGAAPFLAAKNKKYFK